MKNKIETIKTKLDQDKVLYVEDLCKFFRVNKRTFLRKLETLREDYPERTFLNRWFTNWFLFESDLDEFISLLTIPKKKTQYIESVQEVAESVDEVAKNDEFLEYLLDPRAYY